MIKQWLHKSFSIALALLVLISTVSFTVEKHFCGDTLVDVSVFTDVEKCAMEAAEILQKKTCCKDEIDVIQGQDKLKFSDFKDIKFNSQQFLSVFIYSYLDLFEYYSKKIIPHKNYTPPNLIADILVLNQVFII